MTHQFFMKCKPRCLIITDDKKNVILYTVLTTLSSQKANPCLSKTSSKIYNKKKKKSYLFHDPSILYEL